MTYNELNNTSWQLFKFPLKHVQWIFLSVKGLFVKVCKFPDTVKNYIAH